MTLPAPGDPLRPISLPAEDVYQLLLWAGNWAAGAIPTQETREMILSTIQRLRTVIPEFRMTPRLTDEVGTILHGVMVLRDKLRHDDQAERLLGIAESALLLLQDALMDPVEPRGERGQE